MSRYVASKVVKEMKGSRDMLQTAVHDLNHISANKRAPITNMAKKLMSVSQDFKAALRFSEMLNSSLHAEGIE